MPDVPHVPPVTVGHHRRTILEAILKGGDGPSSAEDLVFAIDAVIAVVYAEGFTAGRVRATDAHYAVRYFAEDREKKNLGSARDHI